jgi:hypothetical protein
MQKYAEVCEVGGVSLAAFNIGFDFQNCIDGLVIVDTNMVKQKNANDIFKPYSTDQNQSVLEQR